MDISIYLGLLHANLLDWVSASEYPQREFRRDWLEITNRTHREGIGFLTKTLPRMAKAIDYALATGSVVKIEGFKISSNSKLPKFLGTLLRQIFDDAGCERSDASTVALIYLRQLLYTYYKLELPPNRNDNNRVLSSFVETDRCLPAEQRYASDQSGTFIAGLARTLVRRVLAGTDPVGPGFNPAHGPGSVATGEQADGKPVFKRL